MNILSALAILYTGILLGQTKIDDNISIKFPNKPQTLENVDKKDTLDQSVKTTLKVYYLNSKEESYVVMRLKVLTNDETEPKLPQSQSDLIEKYERFIAGQLNSFAKKGMYIKDKTQINLNNYLAYKLTFKDENSDQEIGQSLILYLNGIIYEFVYSKVDSYNQLNRGNFFKSIEINNFEDIKQIAEPYNYWNALLELLLGGIFLYFIIKFLKMKKKRNLIK